MKKEHPKDLSGLNYHFFYVKSIAYRKNGRFFYNCICDCGKEIVVRRCNLLSGNTVSCGCHRGTHRKSSDNIYGIWRGMLRRCYSIKSNFYHHYGGRGITVCERWLNFENFYADMGDAPDGMSLERANNYGNYEPSNCRWATQKEQNRNKRNNRLLTYNGVTKTAMDWSEELNLNFSTLVKRISRGWSVEMALSTPRIENFNRRSFGENYKSSKVITVGK